MNTKNSTAKIIKETAQNKAVEMKVSKDHATKNICDAIKDVEGKNKAIRKNITAYCNEIRQEIQKLD